MTVEDAECTPRPLRLADLKPYFSITVLECTVEDIDQAFSILTRFLRDRANEPGRAVAVRVTTEIIIGGLDADGAEDADSLRALGLDRLYGLTRERRHHPSWAFKDSMITDVTNELTIALSRDRLVAVHTENTQALLRWADRDTTPFRRLPLDVMSATFDGDGKTLWLRGMHRRRVTKPDAKMLTGLRLQEALDTFEDSTFAMSAMKVNLTSADNDAVLRDDLTVSPPRSHLALRAMSDFETFVAATVEALIPLDKALASERPLSTPYPELAVPEADLMTVTGAFDIRVADPDEIRSEPNPDETRAEHAELLRDTLLAVEGDPTSPHFVVDVGRDGAMAGRLKIKPVQVGDGYELDVRYAAPPSDEVIAREIRDAIGSGDLVNVYYESGHAFTGRQISRQNVTSQPFPNLTFSDFTGFHIMREKPVFNGDQAIHDNIARGGDNSLFAWVVRHFHNDWLICDDGAGEIADFLHLSNDGTLRAIHVKGAHSSSKNRHIAVTAFEQVVSQAEKNVRLLTTEELVGRLKEPRIRRPACWHSGVRIDNRAEFLDRLSMRVTSDKTHVIIVQPHLLRSVHDRARTATRNGQQDRDSYSLMLLDNLLQSTRNTVRGLYDDFTVIGCA